MLNVRPVFQRLALGAGMGLIAAVAYSLTQCLGEARAIVRADCWTWRWLPFSVSWIWPYLSMFVIVGLPWFWLPDLRQVRRFAAVMLAMAATGWIFFCVFPTAVARPAPDGQAWFYATLLAVDRANNCLPCLHSAFSVFAAWALVQSGGIFRRAWVRALLAFWLLLICVSIVGLRQHTDIDTIVGTALGSIGAWVWSRGTSATPMSSPKRGEGRTSESGS